MFPGLRHFLRNALLALAASCAAVTPALAQTLRAGNGTAAAPSITFNNSLTTGLYRPSADVIGLSNAGSLTAQIARVSGAPTYGVLSFNSAVTIAGALGVMGGAEGDSTLYFRVPAVTTSTGKFSFGFASSERFRVDSGSAQGRPGSVTRPTYSWLTDTDLGLYRFGADTLGIATGGVHTLNISGGAAARLTGGAGNMTILAGTGNSRNMLLQATNGSGTATTAITAKFDTVRIHDEVVLPSLTAASGTPNSVCMDATSKQVTENAATSCVVSSRRFKQNILPLTDVVAQRITTQLKPSVFKYRVGGRNAIGLIAEEADSVDSRLATRDGAGRINSVNYEQVTIVLLKQVQTLTAKLDRMCRAGVREAC